MNLKSKPKRFDPLAPIAIDFRLKCHCGATRVCMFLIRLDKARELPMNQPPCFLCDCDLSEAICNAFVTELERTVQQSRRLSAMN